MGFLLLAWLAWRVLTLGLATQLSRTNPGAALALRANHPEAQLREAELRARAASGLTAEQARSAIRSAPLDSRGYRLLARQAEARGDKRAAAELFSLAVTRGPRDLPSLLWLVQHSTARGDFTQAIARIDQILRVQPERAPKMFPVLMALAVHEEAKLAKVLVRGPPWRSAFLAQLFEKTPKSTALSGLVARLRRSQAGMSDAELSAWFERLIQDHEWNTAYLSWVESLPAANSRIGNVFNGGFEHEPSHMGFDWRFVRIPGARMSRAQVSGSEGRYALRVDFEDRRVAFQNVRQLLALVPGTYVLHGRARLDDLRSERGLVWTLVCADGPILGETEPVTGRQPWREFHLAFVVPPSGCGGQWLILRIPARVSAEQRIGGVAWFDDLKIQARASEVP